MYVALLVVGPDGPGAPVISRQPPEGADLGGGRTVAGVKLRARCGTDRAHSKQPLRTGEGLEGRPQ